MQEGFHVRKQRSRKVSRYPNCYPAPFLTLPDFC